MDTSWFEAKCMPIPESGCLIWMGETNTDGYGRIRIGKRRTMAHRISYQLHKGIIPSGMCVCHKCDVPACVRPDHLFLGTAKDNSDDKIAKGRYRSGEHSGGNPPPQKGQLNSRAKLTLWEVDAIRISTKSTAHLASAFGISESQIRRIRARTLW